MKSTFSFVKDTRFPMMLASVVAGVLFVTMAVNASTTISTNISTDGTLGVTGLSTLTAGFVSQASSTIVGAGTITGTAVFSGLASSSTMTVGSDRVSTISGLIFGTCTASLTVTASSSAYADCTGATGVTSSYKVFVQATSSMPNRLYIVAASSTATTGTINLLVANTGINGGNVSASVNTLNFWAVR